MIQSLISIYLAGKVLAESQINTEKLIQEEIENSFISQKEANLTNIIGETKKPIKDKNFIKPIIKARSSIAIDLKSGAILYQKNIDKKLPIASLTKMMTTLIVLEEDNLSDTTKIKADSANIEGSQMYLKQGEIMTLKDLLKGALIASANDAAIALAEANAKTITAFVKKMNEKTKRLGMINTHFANPVGLDDPNNYSTTRDLSKLAKILYKIQLVKDIVKTKEATITSTNKQNVHKVKNTNLLLKNKYYKIKGLKTGTTDLAGECLTSIAEDDNGNQILTIVLNSPNRFQETKVLVDWIFRAYSF